MLYNFNMQPIKYNQVEVYHKKQYRQRHQDNVKLTELLQLTSDDESNVVETSRNVTVTETNMSLNRMSRQ